MNIINQLIANSKTLKYDKVIIKALSYESSSKYIQPYDNCKFTTNKLRYEVTLDIDINEYHKLRDYILENCVSYIDTTIIIYNIAIYLKNFYVAEWITQYNIENSSTFITVKADCEQITY